MHQHLPAILAKLPADATRSPEYQQGLLVGTALCLLFAGAVLAAFSALL
jgi:hypothetical protein